MKCILSSKDVDGLRRFTVLDLETNTLRSLNFQMLDEDIFGVEKHMEGGVECIRVMTVYDIMRRHFMHKNVTRVKTNDFCSRYLVYKQWGRDSRDFDFMKSNIPGVETDKGYKIDCYSKSVIQALHALL